MKLIMETWRRFLTEQSFSEEDGLADENPGTDTLKDLLTQQSEKSPEIQMGPEGQTKFFEFEKLKGYKIWHDIQSDKLEEKVKSFLAKCLDNGLDNPYVIAGSIGTIFKESGFSAIAEKGEGDPGKLMNSSRGIAPRIRTIFRYHTGKSITAAAAAALTSGNGVVAQFNIAYGYRTIPVPRSDGTYHSNKRWHKYLAKFAEQNKRDGIIYNKRFGGYTNYGGGMSHANKVWDGNQINPKLFNRQLAGYKFRGRGLIQTTFKNTYRKVLNASGFSKKERKEIMANPDIIINRQDIAERLCIAQIKFTYDKTLKNRTRPGSPLEPQNLDEGIAFMVSLAMGGGMRFSRLKSSMSAARAKMEKYKISVQDMNEAETQDLPIDLEQGVPEP